MPLRTTTIVAFVATLFALAVGLSDSLGAPQPTLRNISAQAADKPVEQTRKNIQVLKGLPESQLFLVMNFVGDSLGVHCDYCHVKNGKNPQTGVDNWEWEKDVKPQKLIARDMMKMMIELNRTKFNKEAVVTCYTCHRGSTSVERMASLPPKDFAKEALRPKKVLPRGEEIVSKYLLAVGAKQSTASKAIVMRGIVERSSDSPRSFEVILSPPQKCLIKQTTPQGVIRQATNGAAGWTETPKGLTSMTGERLKQFNETVALFIPIKIPDPLPGAVDVGLAKVDDHEVYVLTIQNSSTSSIQMFFGIFESPRTSP